MHAVPKDAQNPKSEIRKFVFAEGQETCSMMQRYKTNIQRWTFKMNNNATFFIMTGYQYPLPLLDPVVLGLPDFKLLSAFKVSVTENVYFKTIFLTTQLQVLTKCEL